MLGLGFGTYYDHCEGWPWGWQQSLEKIRDKRFEFTFQARDPMR